MMTAGSHESERGSFLLSPLDQIYEQEQKLVELRRDKGPIDRAVRALTTNIHESYESVILENVSSSESIEQQLWQLHYSSIQEFRARLGKRKEAAVAAANVPNKKKAIEKQKFERVGEFRWASPDGVLQVDFAAFQACNTRGAIKAWFAVRESRLRADEHGVQFPLRDYMSNLL